MYFAGGTRHVYPVGFFMFWCKSNECGRFYQELIRKMASKKDLSVSDVATFERAKLSFILLKSTLLCLRGTRSKIYEQRLKSVDFLVANFEAALN